MTLTRRRFLTATGAGVAATVFAPQSLLVPARGQTSGLLRSGRFRAGVISADPTPDSIALWTRLDEADGDEERGEQATLSLGLARDAGDQLRTGETVADTGSDRAAAQNQAAADQGAHTNEVRIHYFPFRFTGNCCQV